MKIWAGRRLAAALFGAVACIASHGATTAGEVTDQSTLAETLLERGYGEAAAAAFGRAAAAFWQASPLQTPTILFVDDVEGYANYTPRDGSAFRAGDTLRIYFEPTGYTFTPVSEGFRSALTADIEIRTPGGLILASAEDFVRLEWQGRSKMYEVHATIALPLPDLKPGAYEMDLTLHDVGSSKETTVTLPFSVSE
jgi:hypothetical protein